MNLYVIAYTKVPQLRTSLEILKINSHTILTYKYTDIQLFQLAFTIKFIQSTYFSMKEEP